jgi:hypothetical protein
MDLIFAVLILFDLLRVQLTLRYLKFLAEEEGEKYKKSREEKEETKKNKSKKLKKLNFTSPSLFVCLFLGIDF